MTTHDDWYAHEVPAVVRKRKIFRHRALLDAGRSTAVILLAQGPPRAWQLGLEAAVGGVCEALEENQDDPEPILAAAASRVRGCAAEIIDADQIQLHGAAMAFRDGEVTIASAGSCRAYLQRHTEHRRLTAKSDAKGLKNAYSFPTVKETLEPGDIVVLGPSHIFGVTGVAQMARLFQDRQKVTARALSRGLLSTGETEQTGGAVVALRVVKV